MARSQTDRPGTSQTHHPNGVMYPTHELTPQGVIASSSPRGALLFIVQTNPQRPIYGPGTRVWSTPGVEVLLPPMGPIQRGM